MSEQLRNGKFMYVALGDSLANGVGANGEGYPLLLTSLLQKQRPTELHLFAVNGQTSTQLLRRQQQYTSLLNRADLITVNIGGNDLRLTWRLVGHTLSPKALQRKRMQLAVTTLANNWNELAALIAHNASPQAKVVFLNLYNPYQKKHPLTRAFVDEANALLQTICANHGFIVLDVRTLLNTASKKQPEDKNVLLANDKVHLSRLGQSLVAGALFGQAYRQTLGSKLKNYLAEFIRF